MRITDLPFLRVPKNTAYVDWKLRVTRMKKLLENARAFLGVLADGKEKLTAEYIIDERYVLSLVEKAMERTSMMVHDACLLAPEGGENLYRALDEYWRRARKDLLIPIEKPEGSQEAPLGEEPEVRRLSLVVEWFWKGGEGADSLFTFFKKIVEHVVKGAPGPDFPAQGVMRLETDRGRNKNRIAIMDMDRVEPRGIARTVSVTDIVCRPLGLMLMGGPGGDSGKGGGAARSWFAAVDEDHVSLFPKDPGAPALWLSATLTGYSDSDFVFVLGKNTGPAFFPDGFHVETAGDITFGWTYDVPTHKIEQSLVMLGKRCFAD